jgi:hypothetical protein
MYILFFLLGACTRVSLTLCSLWSAFSEKPVQESAIMGLKECLGGLQAGAVRPSPCP